MLRSLVSNSDPGWAHTVLSVNHTRGLFNRRAGQPVDEAIPRISHIELSPDLSQAEVAARLEFPSAYLPHQTLTLLVPLTMQPGSGGQWRLAPPGPAFWGRSGSTRVNTWERSSCRSPTTI